MMTLKEMKDYLIEYAEKPTDLSDRFIIKSEVTTLRQKGKIVHVFKRGDVLRVNVEDGQVVIQVGDKVLRPNWKETAYKKWMKDNCRSL